jgi:hypothetical protein
LAYFLILLNPRGSEKSPKKVGQECLIFSLLGFRFQQNQLYILIELSDVVKWSLVLKISTWVRIRHLIIWKFTLQNLNFLTVSESNFLKILWCTLPLEPYIISKILDGFCPILEKNVFFLDFQCFINGNCRAFREDIENNF